MSHQIALSAWRLGDAHKSVGQAHCCYPTCPVGLHTVHCFVLPVRAAVHRPPWRRPGQSAPVDRCPGLAGRAVARGPRRPRLGGHSLCSGSGGVRHSRGVCVVAMLGMHSARICPSARDVQASTAAGVATLLLDAGADLTARVQLPPAAEVDSDDSSENPAPTGQRSGWTALHLACREGDVEMARLLTSRGAPVDAANGRNGQTPLHIAASALKPVVIDVLLSCRASVHSTNHLGRNALHEACRAMGCKGRRRDGVAVEAGPSRPSGRPRRQLFAN